VKQLVILSGKGGTGKTTVAGAFIKLTRARAYADCDVDAPNLHLISKHNSEPERNDYYGLPKANIDVKKCQNCSLCEANCRFEAISHGARFYVDWYACEGCGVCEFVCPARAITMKEAVAGEMMLYRNGSVFSTAKLSMGSGTSGKLVSEVKKQLASVVDKETIAIIDGSPGIGCPVIASLSGADMALIVAEPSISGISDMERIITSAKHFGVKTIVCVNKYDININNTRKIESYCRENEIPFAGKIPYDENAIKAINEGKSIAEVECMAGYAIKAIYDRIIEIMKGNDIL
jgi:MinD superfamily P-loop ATPase